MPRVLDFAKFKRFVISINCKRTNFPISVQMFGVRGVKDICSVVLFNSEQEAAKADFEHVFFGEHFEITIDESNGVKKHIQQTNVIIEGTGSGSAMVSIVFKEQKGQEELILKEDLFTQKHRQHLVEILNERIGKRQSLSRIKRLFNRFK